MSGGGNGSWMKRHPNGDPERLLFPTLQGTVSWWWCLSYFPPPLPLSPWLANAHATMRLCGICSMTMLHDSNVQAAVFRALYCMPGRKNTGNLLAFWGGIAIRFGRTVNACRHYIQYTRRTLPSDGWRLCTVRMRNAQSPRCAWLASCFV